MTRILLGTLTAFACVFAQTDISGKWTGSAGVPLYVTFHQDGSKVSGTAGQTPAEELLSFEGSIEADHVTLQAGKFQFDLHVKGNEITGILDTSGEKVPVVLRRAGTEPSPSTPRSFEVASVKHVETPVGGYRSSMNLDPGRLTCTNVSLRKLLVNAYGIKDYQLIGPDWMNTELYDIVGTLPSGATGAEVMPMIQTLLAERFHVAFHRESRELPVYALVVGKNGTKLQPVEFSRGGTSYTPGRFTATSIPMDKFVDFLSRQVEHPVLDQTGLKGVFTFTLEWSTDESNPETGAGLVTAMQQQIGLKLDARKAPVEVLVVDRADKSPTEN